MDKFIYIWDREKDIFVRHLFLTQLKRSPLVRAMKPDGRITETHPRNVMFVDHRILEKYV